MRNPFFRRPRVFISYRRNSGAAFANLLYWRLRLLGVDAFRDTHNIQPGDKFAKIIEREIPRRLNFILVLTPNALESKWVEYEISLALKHQCRIIPIEVGGFKLETAELPPALVPLRDISATEYDTVYDDASVSSIIKAIRPSVRWWLVKALGTGGMVFAAIIGLLVAILYPAGTDGPLATPSDTPPAIAQVATNGPSPSATLNPTEQIELEAVNLLTATSFGVAVVTRAAALQATGDYLAALTATLPPIATNAADGGSSGSGIDTTPTESPTPTVTIEWEETAASQLRDEQTQTVAALTDNSNRPPRVTLTPTSTVNPSATPMPNQAGDSRPPANGSTNRPSSTPTVTPSPSLTPSASATATPTLSPTPTAPTLPPPTAYYGEAVPAIAFNPSHNVIPVYGGPSEDSGIVGFLAHTAAISIQAELPGWVFIGFGWVHFDRVFPVDDAALIPIFQTQVIAMTPAPTTDEDFRAVGYQLMTHAAETGGIAGSDTTLYGTFVAGETRTAIPTRTPTPTSTRTVTPRPTFTATPSRTPAIPTHTPSPTTQGVTGAMQVFNPPQYGCVISSQTINVREQPTTASAVVTTVPSGGVVTVNGQQVDWYRVGNGWISASLLRLYGTQGEAQNQCAPASVPTTNPNGIPPTSGPPPTPGPSPTPEPFSIEILNLNPGVYGTAQVNGQPQGCYASFTVRIRGVSSIAVQVYADNDSIGDPGNLEQTPILNAGDTQLSVTFGGDQNFRGHTIRLITEFGGTSASGSCRDQ